MAIDGRNFSVEGVENILNAGENALDALNAQNHSANLGLAIERLKNKILFLEAQEYEVLKLFTPPNDKASITQRIVNYNNKNFGNFFGINLKDAFIREFALAAKSSKNKILREQNSLAEFLVKELSKQVDNSIQDNEEIKKIIADRLNGEILVEVSKNGARIPTRKKDIINIDEDGIPHIIVEELTEPMRRRLQGILDELKSNKEESRYPNLKRIDISKFQVDKNSLNIQTKSEWFNVIRGLAEKEIEQNLKDDPETWEPIRDAANKKVIDLLCREVSDDIKPTLRRYLEEMIGKESNKNIFFMGKSANDVTGLIGEIAAVVAIKELTGKTVSVEWVAHNRDDDNKKVSIDIVLKYCLGINVKNTTTNFSQENGFYDVPFVERSPNEIIEKLLGSNGEVLGDAFQTSFFNTSYNIVPNRPHVVAGMNGVFDNTMRRLQSFRNHLITFLYQFAPELLYMANDEPLEKQLLILDEQLSKQIQNHGSILYMVGGVPYFPSNMLADLKEDLESLQKDLNSGTNFRDKSFFLNIGSGSSRTIIDVLNQNASNGISVALDGTNYNKKGFVIQMTSSWLF